VNQSVLIPRPETEEIIHALRDLSIPSTPLMLDLGAGSGCIAVTLALEFPASLAVALEASQSALEVLKRNAGSSVRIVRADFHSLCFHPRSFDVITANLPYVERNEYEGLPAETKWEPRTALVVDALEESYRTVLQQCSLLLKCGGYLLMEFGYGQLERLQEVVFTAPELKWIGVRKDQQNIPRVLILQRPC
jgi:release factor glutamine methyltransferase